MRKKGSQCFKNSTHPSCCFETETIFKVDCFAKYDFTRKAKKTAVRHWKISVFFLASKRLLRCTKVDVLKIFCRYSHALYTFINLDQKMSLFQPLLARKWQKGNSNSRKCIQPHLLPASVQYIFSGGEPQFISGV